uniref:Uncharacterized protein n=1 Tax=Rhizophora mucronata TaxID=61149 RepID=A0A2P2NBA4_RHIMU
MHIVQNAIPIKFCRSAPSYGFENLSLMSKIF